MLLFAWNAGAGENGLKKTVRAVELVLSDRTVWGFLMFFVCSFFGSFQYMKHVYADVPVPGGRSSDGVILFCCSLSRKFWLNKNNVFG